MLQRIIADYFKLGSYHYLDRRVEGYEEADKAIDL